MEQDDIKLIWRELNEKINSSEIASKKTLSYILENKRKSVYQRLVSADLAASIGFLVFAFTLGYTLFMENSAYPLLAIEAIIILLTASIFNYFCYRKLSKLNLDGDLISLCRRVTSYKQLVVWTYFVIYAMVLIFSISFLLIFPQTRLVKILLSLIFPVCVVIDCLIYRWSSSQIHTLTDTSKELKELNQWKE